MATFKVGQRVRIVRARNFPAAIGREATVVGTPDQRAAPIQAEDYAVEIDGMPCPDARYGTWWCAPAESLAPLTDPGADAFIERIKNMKPYEEPVAPKVREPSRV